MTLILWLRFWVSALLVALAVILLAVAQRVDEEPVIYWAMHFLGEMVKGLDKQAQPSGVWRIAETKMEVTSRDKSTLS